MKTLIALFAGNKYSRRDERIFAGESAFERSKEWAESFEDACIFVIAEKNEPWTAAELIVALKTEAEKNGADTVLFAWADCPFLSVSLAKEILETHKKYAAEYTFADGYPEGFACEAIDTGALSLLCALCEKGGAHEAAGAKKAGRDAIFSLIKCDINSFEVETVLSPKDFRQYRLRFCCGTKAETEACRALFALKTDGDDALSLSEKAVQCTKILCTVPSFYRVQITEKTASDGVFELYPNAYKKAHGVFPSEDLKAREMSKDQFENLVDEIANFSETAVIALSAGGEPLECSYFESAVEKVLSHAGLSVLVETSGYGITTELAERIAKIAANAPPRAWDYPALMWIVSVDAADATMYAKLHHNAKSDSFEKSIQAVGILSKYFEKNVYPQFLRVNENEEQLEAFFRFWKNEKSPSAGNVLVQKYDWGCGFMEQNKPADLSPLERFPCWHLRRDFTVLSGGEVPICPEWTGESDFLGNVFEEKIGEIWEKSQKNLEAHLKKCYSQKCSVCDEFYTFNF